MCVNLDIILLHFEVAFVFCSTHPLVCGGKHNKVTEAVTYHVF